MVLLHCLTMKKHQTIQWKQVIHSLAMWHHCEAYPIDHDDTPILPMRRYGRQARNPASEFRVARAGSEGTCVSMLNPSVRPLAASRHRRMSPA